MTHIIRVTDSRLSGQLQHIVIKHAPQRTLQFITDNQTHGMLCSRWAVQCWFPGGWRGSSWPINTGGQLHPHPVRRSGLQRVHQILVVKPNLQSAAAARNLKFEGLSGTGGEAKERIQQGEVPSKNLRRSAAPARIKSKSSGQNSTVVNTPDSSAARFWGCCGAGWREADGTMILHSVALEWFRNYEGITVEFAPGVNVIYGENAQGKTPGQTAPPSKRHGPARIESAPGHTGPDGRTR